MNASGSTSVQPGELLAGRFEVQQVLGEGGMGVVVAARHRHLDQPVALKFMLPDQQQSPEARARFLREARAAARLKSQHVARVLDTGTFAYAGGEAPYIAMEFLEGCDLEQLLRDRWPIPVEDAVEYLLQACEAVAEAHANGIIHRDLKPANMFLTAAADGSPSIKVLDFGISKLTSEAQIDDAVTRTNTAMGTPHYMSPEQIRSAKDVDARSDVWALGVIAYELLTRCVPFDAESVTELIARVLESEPTPPCQLRPDLPAELDAVVLGCLAKDPGGRWSSVAQLAGALAPFGPSRARGYGERVARVMAPSLPPADPDLGEADTARMTRAPGSVTGAAWQSSSAGAQTRRRSVAIGAAAIALAGATAVIAAVAGSWGEASPAGGTDADSSPAAEGPSQVDAEATPPTAEEMDGAEAAASAPTTEARREEGEPSPTAAPSPSPEKQASPEPSPAPPPVRPAPPRPPSPPPPTSTSKGAPSKPAYCGTEDAFVEDEQGILRRRPECK